MSGEPNEEFIEPDGALGDPSGLLIGYLQTYRRTLLRKSTGLDDDQLRSTVLPSGWTPLQLIKHLAHVERRWFAWGFLGRNLPDPWGDRDPDNDRWYAGPEDTLESLASFLAEQAAVTDQLLAEHPLDQRAAIGGRFTQDPPTLGWIGFHVLQEYARHLGHLDVVRELIDNSVGE